jgi:disulfide bond formation protein DsbB
MSKAPVGNDRGLLLFGPVWFMLPCSKEPGKRGSMNPLSWSFRIAFAAVAGLCAAFLAFAYYTQFKLGLEPCPLCILQRIAFIAVLVVSIVAALHNPKRSGRAAWGVVAGLAAGAGIAVAGRHVWLQHLPPDKVPDCGPGLEYMLDAFPLSQTVRMVFTGSGECARVDWSFLGLSMPAWTLFWFVVLALGALYYGFRRYEG